MVRVMSDGAVRWVDWASEEHAVCVVDEQGRIIEGRRYSLLAVARHRRAQVTGRLLVLSGPATAGNATEDKPARAEARVAGSARRSPTSECIASITWFDRIPGDA
jgi:hypothetical protein